MKYCFSIFFLIIMTLNVAIPLVERLHLKGMYKLSEVGMDDTDEEGKKEKEKEVEKEKDSISFATLTSVKSEAFYLELFRKSLFSTNDRLISDPYTSLPERPPQA